MRGLLTIRGETDADEPAIALAAALPLAPRLQVQLFARKRKRLAIVAAVVMFARHVVVRHVGRRDEIVIPDLPWLAADRAGDGIDHQLHGEADAGSRHAAIRQKAGLVRRHAVGPAAIPAEVVRSRQVAGRLTRLQRDGERPGRVRAAVDRDLRIERQQLAAFVGMGGHSVTVLARIGADHQVLATILDVAERSPEFQRQPRDAQLFRLEDTFVAETAPHVGRDDPHLSLVDAEKLRQADADDMRDLGRCMHDDLAAAIVPLGEHGLALHRHHGLPGERDLALDDDRRALGLCL